MCACFSFVYANYVFVVGTIKLVQQTHHLHSTLKRFTLKLLFLHLVDIPQFFGTKIDGFQSHIYIFHHCTFRWASGSSCCVWQWSKLFPHSLLFWYLYSIFGTTICSHLLFVNLFLCFQLGSLHAVLCSMQCCLRHVMGSPQFSPLVQSELKRIN